MRPFKFVLAVVISGVLAGCAGVDTASRNAGFDRSLTEAQALALVEPTFAVRLPSYSVAEINVVVPEGLIVSEANRFYPNSDIVWHGDPPGNRHEQIKAIFDTAIARATQDMQGDVPVALDVTLERFHALTPRTRYTVGGVHSITFTLAVRDAQSGFLLEEPRTIEANLKGFGGQRAIDAERQGQTQKVRITAHLASVFEDELRAPEPRARAVARQGQVNRQTF